MKELFLRTLVIAYGATGVIGLVAYWPTIKDLYCDKKQSANISSYILWTFSCCIGFLYSIFILPDLLLRIVVGLNLVACLAVLILSLKLRGINEKQNS